MKYPIKVIQFRCHRPTSGSISSHNLAGLISEVSEEVGTQIAKKLPSSTTPLSFEAPPRGTPANIRIYHIFPETRVIGLHFCRCKYGSIFIQICAVASGLQKTHLFCNRVRFGRSRSLRGIQGRWFWYQSKARMRLPISRSLWLWSYFAPFLRYGDLLAKNCLFFLPLSHLAPLLPMFPLEFCGVTMRKLESWGLSSSEDRMIVAGVVLAWYRTVTDRQTDRRNLP